MSESSYTDDEFNEFDESEEENSDDSGDHPLKEESSESDTESDLDHSFSDLDSDSETVPIIRPTTPFPVKKPTAPFPGKSVPVKPIPTPKPVLPPTNKPTLPVVSLPTTGKPTVILPTSKLVIATNKPSIPSIPKPLVPSVSKVENKSPLLPGFDLKVVKTKQVARPMNSDEINTLIKEMPGIYLLEDKRKQISVTANINDLLEKEADELDLDFSTRSQLTLLIASLSEPKINNITAVTIGFMIMKKVKSGITYDDNIENIISYIISILSGER